jgi:hypothetical protein
MIQPVEKLLAEFMRKCISLTAEDFSLLEKQVKHVIRYKKSKAGDES